MSSAENQELRHSKVAYVAACLRVDRNPHFLVAWHRKWNDWSLAGGHVEESDGDWSQAAAREVQEELPPLVHNKDFVVLPIFSEPITWGPTPSRSANNRPTIYRAQFFSMTFLKDPSDLLAAVSSKQTANDLRLVSQERLERDTNLSEPLRILRDRLRSGLMSIPLAWPDDLPKGRLPDGYFASTQSAASIG